VGHGGHLGRCEISIPYFFAAALMRLALGYRVSKHVGSENAMHVVITRER
jgi:hypothetical protein